MSSITRGTRGSWVTSLAVAVHSLFSEASGLDSETRAGVGGQVPHPSHSSARPLPRRPPAGPWASCLLTDPVISGEHTQEVRPGRAHPNPDLHGREHKKPPFLARGSLLPRAAVQHARPPRWRLQQTGRWAASGGASGGWRGVGSILPRGGSGGGHGPARAWAASGMAGVALEGQEAGRVG